MALLQACLLLPPTLLGTTFHRIETIPFDREVEKDLVSEEDEKGGEADAGFFLPYRKFPDIPGTTEGNFGKPSTPGWIPRESSPAYEETTEYRPNPDQYMATHETTTEYQPITGYEPTTTYRSPVQWERRMDEETRIGDDFEQESPPANTENVRPTDNVMSDEFKSKMEEERTETESAKSFSMDESMMDISKGETVEEKSEFSQSTAAETGDQGRETTKEDVMSGLEPPKGEAELMAEFDSEEAKYKNFPTSPANTRRMFEHPAGAEEAQIALQGRRNLFRKVKKLPEEKDEGNVCTPRPDCSGDQKFRTMDGTCNSLTNPLRGSKNSPYLRLLPPAYGDGVFLPRGVTLPPSPEQGYQSSLPSPRVISDTIMSEGDQNDTESKTNTHMVMQWGQFIDHDIISTSKDAFDCCNPEIKNLCRCFPIEISSNDSFFAEFGRTCLDFTRSDVHCRDGEGGWGEQFNKQTAFIDASAVYGCHQELAMKLRGGTNRQGGRLVSNSQLPNFLPSNFDVKMRRAPSDKPTDFVAGDERAETQASLTSIQNLFFNEHNRIASHLFSALKGKMDDLALDERVYQETRRLVSAEMQHITYTQFLPAVLGEAQMASHGMNHENCEFRDSVDPGILNSFATAAYRFGHSLVQSIFRGVNQPWRLGKFYADSRFAFKDNGHGFVNELEGLSQQPCMQADLHMSNQLSRQLFCNKESEPGSGHDLVSTNIQRGRDHGIPGYSKVREKCGLLPILSLQERPMEINEENWAKLSEVYQKAEDVDLYVGGLSETPVGGGIVGPTFACIISGQFKALMDGDRFFYRHTAGPEIRPLTGAMLE